MRYLEASDYAPQHRKTQPISGLAQYLPALQTYKETDVYHPTESWLEMKDRKKRERKEQAEKLLTEGPKTCEGHLAWFDDIVILLLTLFALQLNPTRIQTFGAIRLRR